MTHAAVCGNARFLIHRERPGIQPASSKTLCWVLNLLEPQQELLTKYFFLSTSVSKKKNSRSTLEEWKHIPKNTLLSMQTINKWIIHCCNSEIKHESLLWNEWMNEQIKEHLLWADIWGMYVKISKLQSCCKGIKFESSVGDVKPVHPSIQSSIHPTIHASIHPFNKCLLCLCQIPDGNECSKEVEDPK